MTSDVDEGKTKPAGVSAAEIGDKAGQVVESVAKPLGFVLTIVLPPLITYTAKIVRFLKKLPKDEMKFLIGAIFCFFGGIYPTLFAAVQAAEQGGRAIFVESVSQLSEEALKVLDASKKDDDRDDDKDGKKDVDQISGKEYAERKLVLILTKVDPQKVDNAMNALYTVWLSVAAVLSIQFARTISMALSLAAFLNRPSKRFIAPLIEKAVPDEYDRWVPVILGWINKSIAMSLAWYIQSVISAFTSAVTGGLMMARALYSFCYHHKFTLFGLITNSDSDSYIDEMLSYGFAALGFYFQFMLNFDMPFPLNVVFLPFEIAEWWIRWTITE